MGKSVFKDISLSSNQRLMTIRTKAAAFQSSRNTIDMHKMPICILGPRKNIIENHNGIV